MTPRELNTLLLASISNLMTDDQLDVKLDKLGGRSTRQVLADGALVAHTLIIDDAVKSRAAAQSSPIKGYWHRHGYLCATKPNGEWQPLVLQFPEN